MLLCSAKLVAPGEKLSLKLDKSMKRGDMDCYQCDGLIFVKWYDYKAVMLLTSIQTHLR